MYGYLDSDGHSWCSNRPFNLRICRVPCWLSVDLLDTGHSKVLISFSWISGANVDLCR